MYHVPTHSKLSLRKKKENSEEDDDFNENTKNSYTQDSLQVRWYFIMDKGFSLVSSNFQLVDNMVKLH